MPSQQSCAFANQSDDFFDFIVESDFNPAIHGIPSDYCRENFGVKYEFLHVPQSRELDYYIERLGYTAIPKAFGLMDTTSVESTGALRLQNQPVLTLRGQGVLIGIIDTGIAYDLPIFKNEDGTSRIVGLWDQTLPVQENGGGVDDTSAYYVDYGRSYNNEQINEALQSANPYEVIPSIDEEEHGTFLAGIAAGRYDRNADFIGAAPDSNLVIVKLKQVKTYLRDFYGIAEGVPAYSEIDIMNGVKYLMGIAHYYMKPIVILVSAGTNQGGHDGRMPLSDYLSTVADTQGIAVVQAAGNEGNARRHYVGRVSEQNWDTVELRVGEGVKGFTIELWGNALNTFYVGLRSPSGRVIPPIFPQGHDQGHQYRFPAEGSVVTIFDRVSKMQGGDYLVLVRFENPSEGVWQLQVAVKGSFATDYHLWMPIRQFVPENTYFLSSNPYTTLTSNACAVNSITVGMYQHLTDSLTPEGSKGFTRTSLVKPDILAPGVNVYGPLSTGAYGTMTGSSVAAAHAAGAAALIFEYGVVKGNFSYMDGADARSILVRSASRKESLQYPNRDWGYGTLNVYQAFQEFVGQL